ncbi:hypothetical protein OAD50_04270 [Vicingaceae bacterium]|nr:hypothetical protein [Vicingaceae bacterium]
MKNILFITGSSLATNPRLTKNYIYFSSKGYKCTVIAFIYGDWTDKLSQIIIDKHHINCILIPASRDQFIPWIKAGAMGKISKLMYWLNPSPYWTAVASSKRVFQLLAELKKVDFPVDFIEGHTLAALYPSDYLSKKLDVPFLYDVEDYHPEEIIVDAGIKEKFRRFQLFKNHIPSASFVTAASPLIGKEVEKLLGWGPDRIVPINNSFFSNEFNIPQNIAAFGVVQFVWFSQKITFGRGLELFIEAATFYRTKIELTLIGSLDFKFYNELIEPNKDFIKVQAPLSQTDIHGRLNCFDIGLAIELTSVDFNKDICLSNKLFAYLQAGLFLFATDTKGHINILKDYPDAGLINEQSMKDFSIGIGKLIESIDSIRENRSFRFENAKVFAYEKEVKKVELGISKL